MASSVPIQQQEDPLEVAAKRWFRRHYPSLYWSKPSPEKQEAYREAHRIIMKALDVSELEIKEAAR